MGKPKKDVEVSQEPATILDFYEELLCENEDERAQLEHENNQRFINDPGLEKTREQARAIIFTANLAQNLPTAEHVTKDDRIAAFQTLASGGYGLNRYRQETNAQSVRAMFDPLVAHQLAMMSAALAQGNANKTSSAVKYFADRGVNLANAADLLRLEQLSQLSQNKADALMSRAHYDADVREAVTLLKGMEN